MYVKDGETTHDIVIANIWIETSFLFDFLSCMLQFDFFAYAIFPCLFDHKHLHLSNVY
jgi:hypothetical protein